MLIVFHFKPPQITLWTMTSHNVFKDLHYVFHAHIGWKIVDIVMTILCMKFDDNRSTYIQNYCDPHNLWPFDLKSTASLYRQPLLWKTNTMYKYVFGGMLFCSVIKTRIMDKNTLNIVEQPIIEKKNHN